MISVKCESPSDVKGHYQFATYEGFAHWLADIRRARSGVGAALCALAEGGSWRPNKVGCQMQATSDWRYGYDAKELAREVGVINMRRGDSWSKDPQLALEFARRLDKLR